MKNIVMLMSAVAMLVANSASAQNYGNQGNMGKGSAAGSKAGTSSGGGMPWLIGLGTLGLVATVVGLAASSTAHDPASYGH